MNIDEINIANSLNNNDEYIELNIDIFNSINNLKKTLKSNNDSLVNYVKNKILTNKNRTSLSCRKLPFSYYIDTGNYIGKSTIHKIIRHKLGFHYLKTT